jgi:hypothetical protein
MGTDGKPYLFSVYISFLEEIGPGLEKPELKTGSGYAGIVNKLIRREVQ